jgi:hypothetical protein
VTEPTWDDTVRDILNTLATTLVDKQHDYGHDNILWGGPEGVLVRAHDKIARLKNLMGRDQPANESLRDSWLDLAGYAIIGIMLLDGTFTRTLAVDKPPIGHHMSPRAVVQPVDYQQALRDLNLRNRHRVDL